MVTNKKDGASNSVKTLLQLFIDLDINEKIDFISKITISDKAIKEQICNKEVKEIVCPYCGGKHIVKNGHSKNTQRYICRECKRSFNIRTNTVLYHTKKSYIVWHKYIECMLNGFSIRKSAELCELTVRNSFNMRHKILDALQNMHDAVKLDGVVESDETFFALSFKGNARITKEDFVILHNRTPRKNGKSLHIRGISKEQVCVPSAINRDGLSISKISNLGKARSIDLEKVLGTDKIEENSVLVTDRDLSYIKFSNEHNLKLVQIKTGKGSSKDMMFNMGRINAYHNILKTFINRNFHGVSTKYLNNYLVWNNIKNYSKGSFKEKLEIWYDFVTTTKFNERCRDIAKRKAIPI